MNQVFIVMKYILNETQYNLVLEQTSGLDEFLVKVKEKYDIDDNFIDAIVDYPLVWEWVSAEREMCVFRSFGLN